MEDCIGKGVHLFEPRYDQIEEVDKEQRDKAIDFYERDGTAPMLDFVMHKKIYVYDICVHCGQVVKRN